MSANWSLTGWLSDDVKDLESYWDPTKMNFLGGQKEKCATTGRLHWQAWVQFTTRKRFTGVTKVFGPGKDWHVERVVDLPAMVDYVKKEDTRVEAYREWGRFNTQGKAAKAWGEVSDAIHDGADKKRLWLSHDTVMSTRYRAAYEMMSVLRAPTDKAKYGLDEFKDWEPITEWDTSWVLWGASQIGKTQFALAHFKNPLLVSHIDELKHFSAGTHDGIVFDDMSFTHTPRTAQIHLVDQNNSRAIHIRYGLGMIPAHTKITEEL